MDTSAVGKRAEELFGDTGLYCAESVLKAVSEFVGIDSPLIPKMATGFCGGMARYGGLCGAVSGGVMALGMVFGRDSADIPTDDAYVNVREFLAAFERKHGGTYCFDLTGYNLDMPEGREMFRTSGAVKKCKGFVESAANMVAGLIISGRE